MLGYFFCDNNINKLQKLIKNINKPNLYFYEDTNKTTICYFFVYVHLCPDFRAGIDDIFDERQDN